LIEKIKQLSELYTVWRTFRKVWFRWPHSTQCICCQTIKTRSL